MITPAFLKQHAVSPEIADWINNTEFPPELSLETVILGLLDSYYLAQVAYNKVNTPLLNFIGEPRLTNAAPANVANKYTAIKTFQVNARVNSDLSSVQPATK